MLCLLIAKGMPVVLNVKVTCHVFHMDYYVSKYLYSSALYNCIYYNSINIVSLYITSVYLVKVMAN